jgi:hypothetical protein
LLIKYAAVFFSIVCKPLGAAIGFDVFKFIVFVAHIRTGSILHEMQVSKKMNNRIVPNSHKNSQNLHFYDKKGMIFKSLRK